MLLNLSPDHSGPTRRVFSEYVDAKARIFANQTSSDAMVINADDPHVLEVARRESRQAVCGIAGLPTSLEEGIVTVSGDQRGVSQRPRVTGRCYRFRLCIRVRGRHLL